MTKLVVASHADCPPIRQTLCADDAAADRQAVDFVNIFVSEYFEKPNVEEEIAEIVGFPLVHGGDWRWKLRAVQWARLVEIEGDVESAGAVVASWTKDTIQHGIEKLTDYDAQSFSPLTNPEHAKAFDAFVADDDTEEPDAQIGFPRVWIETPEQRTEPVDPATVADMALVLELAERFVNEGEIADRDDDARGNAQHAIARLRSTCTPVPTDRAPIAFALRNASGAISSLLHQVGQMSGMFDDADGTIQDAVDAGEEAETELDNAIATLEAAPPAGPITVAVSVSGGVLQWGGADRGGVQLIVVDYDQDGAEPHRVVDMAEPGDRPEIACVGFETVEVNAEAIQHIKDKLAESELREKRFDDNDCILCGTDLDAPSATGAEDGICPGCMGPHGGGEA